MFPVWDAMSKQSRFLPEFLPKKGGFRKTYSTPKPNPPAFPTFANPSAGNTCCPRGSFSSTTTTTTTFSKVIPVRSLAETVIALAKPREIDKPRAPSNSRRARRARPRRRSTPAGRFATRWTRWRRRRGRARRTLWRWGNTSLMGSPGARRWFARRVRRCLTRPAKVPRVPSVSVSPSTVRTSTRVLPAGIEPGVARRLARAFPPRRQKTRRRSPRTRASRRT
mmetsp:Transcript_861/g.3310  ORF Transcript_861/g.3310 Transcript_861/m.3310 type:complete len:223 (+) Transcript_861:4081-4749(+)